MAVIFSIMVADMFAVFAGIEFVIGLEELLTRVGARCKVR
jgi:hypothetical protein